MPNTGFSPTVPVRLNMLLRSCRTGLTVVTVVPRGTRLGVGWAGEPEQPDTASNDAAASTATIRTGNLHCVRTKPGRTYIPGMRTGSGPGWTNRTLLPIHHNPH